LAQGTLRWARRRRRHTPADRRERRDRAGPPAQEHGVEEFHFYTLNRAELTYASVMRSACDRVPRDPRRRGAERHAAPGAVA
jgi:hypothetical protein